MIEYRIYRDHYDYLEGKYEFDWLAYMEDHVDSMVDDVRLEDINPNNI